MTPTTPTNAIEEVTNFLKRARAASIEEIVDITNFDRAAVMEALLQMQSKGLVRVRRSSTLPDEIAVVTDRLLHSR